MKQIMLIFRIYHSTKITKEEEDEISGEQHMKVSNDSDQVSNEEDDAPEKEESETSPDLESSIPEAAIDSEEDRKAFLDKLVADLNSKERRKLTRKLERKEATLEQVIEEAQKLVHEKQQPSVDNDKETSSDKSTNNKRPAQSEQTDSADKSTSKSRPAHKRRRKTDWSDLPPEERLRREEQRRLQKEAAERRERGEDSSSHKHPLNSERRRANRRKPKWLKKQAFQQLKYKSSKIQY